MSDDIVEWLRGLSKRRMTAWGPRGLAGVRFDEAADEIDRLRAALYEAECKREDAIEAVDIKDKELILERGRRTEAEREIEREKAQTKIVLDSYVAENQQLSDRAERAEARVSELEEKVEILEAELRVTKQLAIHADLAAAREVIKQWQKPRYIRLHAGEMTAGEMRSVLAVVNAIARTFLERTLPNQT